VEDVSRQYLRHGRGMLLHCSAVISINLSYDDTHVLLQPSSGFLTIALYTVSYNGIEISERDRAFLDRGNIRIAARD
jgi:hypothetical protein